MSRNKREELKEQSEVATETAENLEEPQKESGAEDLTPKVTSVDEDKEIIIEAAPEKVGPEVITPPSLETVVGIPRNSKKFRMLRNTK